MAYSPNRIEKSELMVDAGAGGNSDYKPVGSTEINGARAVNVSIQEGMLAGVTFDYIAVSYPTSTTERFTYKLGGSGGTNQAEVELTYTNSSKASLLSVERLS